MSTLSWQAGTASGPFLVGTLIQALIYVNDPSYVWENWHGTLLVIGITLVVFVANVWGARAMPMFQNLMLVVHVFGFISVIAVFWALAPHNSAEITFTRFTNGGGWNSMGLALMIGQISAIYACICSDAAAHMSEEIKDAGITVPRAMVWAYLLNGGLGFVFLISFLFAITDLDAALNDETGYPFLTVFASAVSTAGVNGLTAIVTLLIFAGTLSFNLSTSRQTWAFARDAGLPFSKFIAHVDPKLKVPANAVGVTAAVTIILSLINIGSDVAFNAIISLNLVSLMLTYMCSIGCVLYRRIYHPELLPQCRWSLGRAGIPVNAAGFIYSTFAFFWCFWPNATPVTADNFNWSVVMFFAILVGCVVDWFVRGRKKFTGPVVLVDGWTGPMTG